MKKSFLIPFIFSFISIHFLFFQPAYSQSSTTTYFWRMGTLGCDGNYYSYDFPSSQIDKPIKIPNVDVCPSNFPNAGKSIGYYPRWSGETYNRHTSWAYVAGTDFVARLADRDSDNDGIFDYNEDDDGDGIPNWRDSDYTLDTDGDGTPNSTDTDDDNDGIPDSSDPNPLTPDIDTDGDGIPDSTDTDDDNDGILDSSDPDPSIADTDGDGTPNSTDTDDDNDGIPDSSDPNPLTPDIDTDGDGIPDSSDPEPQNPSSTALSCEPLYNDQKLEEKGFSLSQVANSLIQIMPQSPSSVRIPTIISNLSGDGTLGANLAIEAYSAVWQYLAIICFVKFYKLIPGKAT